MDMAGELLTDPDDYILDLSSAARADQQPETKSTDVGRPFLSIHFKCCKVYSRIYRNAAGDAYVGHCPRCARALRVPIGPGGSQKRAFVAE
jgi:hypothetical protein